MQGSVAKKLQAGVQPRDSDACWGWRDMQDKLEEAVQGHRGARNFRQFAGDRDRGQPRDRALPAAGVTILDPRTGRSVTIGAKMRP